MCIYYIFIALSVFDIPSFIIHLNIKYIIFKLFCWKYQFNSTRLFNLDYKLTQTDNYNSIQNDEWVTIWIK